MHAKWANMCNPLARIKPGQAIVMRGVAGSVGACATQMAKEAEASVCETVRVGVGAEPVAESERGGVQLASLSLDAVIDTIGGDALKSTCDLLRPNGTMVSFVPAPDEVYLQSKGMRAAYIILDVTRDRLERISAMVEPGMLGLPVGRGSRPRKRKHRTPHAGSAPHNSGKIVFKIAD